MYEHYYRPLDGEKKYTKEEFYQQLDKAHIDFSFHFSDTHRKGYGFKEEVLIREFITYLKNQIGGN